MDPKKLLCLAQDGRYKMSRQEQQLGLIRLKYPELGVSISESGGRE